MEPLEQYQGYTLLRVRVQPKASRNAVRMEPDGRFRVVLTAPPVEGAANKALVQFLAKVLEVTKSALGIHAGYRSRDKTIKVVGYDLEYVREKLEKSCRRNSP